MYKEKQESKAGKEKEEEERKRAGDKKQEISYFKERTRK